VPDQTVLIFQAHAAVVAVAVVVVPLMPGLGALMTVATAQR
jgi:hypothetical protein